MPPATNTASETTVPKLCNRHLGMLQPLVMQPSQLAMLPRLDMLRRLMGHQLIALRLRLPRARPGALRRDRPFQTGNFGGSPHPVPAAYCGRDGGRGLLRFGLKGWRAGRGLGY